ncbi:MAG: ORF6N domain-containing protein [Verrucomicrobiae bacterium]|nr:ORF6N domain-containing protein [Verrucomicrobiae bacterium]
MSQIQTTHISSLIHSVRGHRVILDSDLAALYGVTTKAFNQAVKRNADRFPEAFMFQLTPQEFQRMRSQFVTASAKRNIRFLPHVFTEHGALMAANVLNSPSAIKMSVQLIEAFVRLRRMALSVEALARKINSLETKYDKRFQVVFDALRELMTPPPDKPKRRIGFHP